MSSSSYIGTLGAGQAHDFSGHYVFPASSAQQRLWFLCELEPDSNAAYNVISAVRMTGALDRLRLQQAIDAVVARHESLRSGVALVDGAPQQVVLPSALIAVPMVDCRGLDADARRRRLADTVREEQARPFPLYQPPLVRMVLLCLAEDEHVLVVTVHHIVCDGWSMEVFFRDLARGYDALLSGGDASGEPLPIQYADYVAWQNDQLSGERTAELLAYWREKLAGAQPLNLPTDRPRPAVRTLRGAQCTEQLTGQLAARLEAMGKEHGATLFMVLLTAFKAVLGAYGGQRDIAVGTPVAGRNHPQADELIGFFANTLVLRSEIDPAAEFTEVLAGVRRTCVEALSHQDMPFDRLVEELRPPRDLSRTLLFQVMFALQNTPGVTLEVPGLSLTQVEPETASAKFDLWLNAVPATDGLQLRLEYNRDLFDESTARRLLSHYLEVLQGAAAAPRRSLSRLLDTTAPQERALLLERSRTTAPAEPVPGVCALLRDRAARTPDTVAVSAPDGTLSHRALHEHADRLAHRLRAAGAGPGTVVAVCLPPSADLAVAVLAVLASGAAQVRLGPGSGHRASWVAADAAPDMVVTTRAAAGGLPATLPDTAVRVLLDDASGQAGPPPGGSVDGLPGRDDPAWIGYAFGSAVRPPGVVLSHRALATAVTALAHGTGTTEAHAVSVLGDAADELAVPGLLLGLLHGSHAVLLPEVPEDRTPGNSEASGNSSDSGACAVPPAMAALQSAATDTVLATPDVWQRVLDQDGTPPAGLRLLSIGEPHTGEPGRRLAAAGAQVRTVHSPAAAPVCGVFEETGEDTPRPRLGAPAPGAARYVLDPQLRPTPVGVVGELYAGGPSLGDGYHGRPAETAARFVPDPFADEPGARLYRTGDLCRYTPAGELEFVGRSPHLIRLGDRWVDPAEVEAVLTAHRHIAQAAVVASEFGDDVRLVGWLVPHREDTVGTQPATDGELVRLLRRDAAAALPEELLPQVYGIVDELPVRPDGRIDRRNLQAKKAEAVFGSTDATPPRNATERRLVAVFQEMLGIQAPGVHANFFSLGGHSLLAAKLIARVRKVFGVLVPVRDFFKRPTAAGLAEALGNAKKGRTEPAVGGGDDSDAASDDPPGRRAGASARGALAGISDDEVTRLLRRHLSPGSH
ncbi:condensation domain-containing protein [Streptomyces lydicus]|uniref:condensation domain-containing protein n=1 Tax=Streptomyces lydicus TaxID=47763 RepID=UPI0037A8EDED